MNQHKDPLFVSWLPFKLRFNIVSSVNHLFIGWLRIICGVRYQVVGKENLPQDRPFVLLVNHQSEWETIYLQLLVKPISTVLKKELLRIPFFGWALKITRPIAIDRGSPKQALRQTLEEGIKRLSTGISVLIFPEGTRVSPGEKGKYARGGINIAIKANAPIVPIALNAGEFWPADKFLKFPGTISVVIGNLNIYCPS